jgi:hypothetical protein
MMVESLMVFDDDDWRRADAVERRCLASMSRDADGLVGGWLARWSSVDADVSGWAAALNAPVFVELHGEDGAVWRVYSRPGEPAAASNRVVEWPPPPWQPQPLRLVSRRGHQLAIRFRPSVDTITVELHTRWRELHLVHPDGTFEEIELDRLEGHRHPSEPLFGEDGCPNPRIVQRMCESNRWLLQALARELIVGRWKIDLTSD